MTRVTIIFIVCFDVQLHIIGGVWHDNSTLANENATPRWKLGACTSLNAIEDGETYQYPAIYTERCCLESGRHTLVCYNYPPSKGWKNAYVLINGHQYCDDFISYKSFQKIYVSGICYLYRTIHHCRYSQIIFPNFSSL